jgi:hypothetical protein
MGAGIKRRIGRLSHQNVVWSGWNAIGSIGFGQETHNQHLTQRNASVGCLSLFLMRPTFVASGGAGRVGPRGKLDE